MSNGVQKMKDLLSFKKKSTNNKTQQIGDDGNVLPVPKEEQKMAEDEME